MKPENSSTKKKHSRIFQLALKDALKTREPKSSYIKKEQEKENEYNENVPGNEQKQNILEIGVLSENNRKAENACSKRHSEDQTDSLDQFKLPLFSSKSSNENNKAKFCSKLGIKESCDSDESISELKNYLLCKSEINCRKLGANENLPSQQTSPMDDFTLPLMLNAGDKNLFSSGNNATDLITENTNFHSDFISSSYFFEQSLNSSPAFSPGLFSDSRYVSPQFCKETIASTGSTSTSCDTSNLQGHCHSVAYFGSVQSFESVLSDRSCSDENVHSNTSSGFFEMPSSTSLNGLTATKSAVTRSISCGGESSSQAESPVEDDFGLEKHFEEFLQVDTCTFATDVIYKTLKGAYSSQTVSDTKRPVSESSISFKRPGESFAPLKHSANICSSENDIQTKRLSSRLPIDNEVLDLDKHFECLFY